MEDTEMAKKIYRAIGTDLKRTTDREYTHAIVGFNAAGEAGLAYTWCGRPDLAQKAISSSEFTRRAAYREEELRIVEVERIK